MKRNAVTLTMSLGLAGLGMQLAQRLAGGEVASPYDWAERLSALELGVVLGLLTIVGWSLLRTRLVDALEHTRLEDVLQAPDGVGRKGDCGQLPFVRGAQRFAEVEEWKSGGRRGSAAVVQEPSPAGMMDELSA
jgi:hypothetical protein